MGKYPPTEADSVGGLFLHENGKIVEVGTYDELVEKDGKFAELERLSHFHSIEQENI